MKFMPAATRFLGRLTPCWVWLATRCPKTVISPVEAWQSFKGILCVAEPSKSLCYASSPGGPRPEMVKVRALEPQQWPQGPSLLIAPIAFPSFFLKLCILIVTWSMYQSFSVYTHTHIFILVFFFVYILNVHLPLPKIQHYQKLKIVALTSV